MSLGVQHDEDHTFVVVMADARPSSAESLDLTASRFDVIDLHVEMNSHLGGLGLGHALEGQSG